MINGGQLCELASGVGTREKGTKGGNRKLYMEHSRLLEQTVVSVTGKRKRHKRGRKKKKEPPRMFTAFCVGKMVRLGKCEVV